MIKNIRKYGSLVPMEGGEEVGDIGKLSEKIPNRRIMTNDQNTVDASKEVSSVAIGEFSSATIDSVRRIIMDENKNESEVIHKKLSSLALDSANFAALAVRVGELEGDLSRIVELLVKGDLDSAKFKKILAKRQGVIKV